MLTRLWVVGCASTLLVLNACVSVEEVVPPENRLAGVVTAAPPSLDEPLFVGVELEETLSGTLDDLTFLSGLTVISVASGSPAQRVGIRRGDRLLAVDGVELTQMDQWGAVLAARKVGDTLNLEVERGQGRSEVQVTLGSGGSGHLPAPVRHVEHWRARVVVESVAVTDGETEVVVAEVVELLPESPLAAAGIEPGSRIHRVDGRPVSGAGELVTWLAQQDFGARLALEVSRGGEHEQKSIRLWSPPRSVTEARVPILFGYSADVHAEEVEFTLVDLWFLSLFEYQREGRMKSWAFLRWFKVETGAGELVEVNAEAPVVRADS